MYLSTGYEDRKSRIEIVPLIDVVFLLLVFFIYAMLSMTVYRGLRVDLPAGSGKPEKSRTAVITIAEDNALWMDGKEVDFQKAVKHAAALATLQNRPVLVSGDKRADLGIAIELLSALRKADVSSVSFRIREEE